MERESGEAGYMTGGFAKGGKENQTSQRLREVEASGQVGRGRGVRQK